MTIFRLVGPRAENGNHQEHEDKVCAVVSPGLQLISLRGMEKAHCREKKVRRDNAICTDARSAVLL